MTKKNYLPPKPALWQGRDDGIAHERLFQSIECLDLNTSVTPTSTQNGRHYALLGFSCDQGVIRNQGRPGAKNAPAAIRKRLANLPLHQTASVTDVGDIVCRRSLATAQQQLGTTVAELLEQGYSPLVLGGGHETAWGHFQGIDAAGLSEDIGIINFDAHFDLRPLLADGDGSSGTPFLQIAEQQQAKQRDFNYLCLGIQPLANTRSLFETAEEFGCQYILAEDFYLQDQADIMRMIQRFLDAHSRIYLSICLDVFSAAHAPGVSAPQAFGLLPQHVLFYLRMIAHSGKVVSMDVVELSPPFDRDDITATLAAQLLLEYISSTPGIA